ncbi:hypothetical protein KP509_37G067200, partial [Ceratopteris richardii]
ENSHNFRYPHVPSFLNYINNRQVVHFRGLEKPSNQSKTPNRRLVQATAPSFGRSLTGFGRCGGRFMWRIENLSKVNLRKFYSEAFTVGGCKWRILLFPKGNNSDCLSIYLDVADAPSLTHGWTRYAQFSLAVVNQYNSKLSVRKETLHHFNAKENNWGFTSFTPLREVYDGNKGFYVNDTLILEA